MSKAKVIGPNVERFMACKSIINDLYEYNGDAIRSKKTVRATAQRLLDMDWMVDEINRLLRPDSEINAKRFVNVAKQVKQIVKERHRAITAGSFIDMSAAVFARYRFLVMELEKVILPLVDDDVFERITGDVLADEDENRVKINLEDPDDPDDDDSDLDDEKVRLKEMAGVG